jgi:hypothetical protein
MTSNPHNSARAGEVWDSQRIREHEQLIEALFLENPDAFALSGGFAWHVMSPLGHKEEKIFHDHKDIDIFVRPNLFQSILPILKRMGFNKVQTRHDDPSRSFVRYTKFSQERPKLVLDLFVEEVPSILISCGATNYRIVEPSHLLSLYSSVHTSTTCTAVLAAKELLAKGISPIGRPELIGA